METLWRTTIQRNPACWLAENNLGVTLANRGEFKEAIPHYERSLQLKPDYEKAHYNLGLALASRGDVDKAMAEFRTAAWKSIPITSRSTTAWDWPWQTADRGRSYRAVSPGDRDQAGLC